MHLKGIIFTVSFFSFLLLFSCKSEEKAPVVNKKPVAELEVNKKAREVHIEKGNKQAVEAVNVSSAEDIVEKPELLEIYVETMEEEAGDNGEMFPDDSQKKGDLTKTTRKDEGKKATVPAKPKKRPAISFETKTHKYGMIMQGDKVKYDFKFKNTGKKELVISNAEASCGCTQPSFPFLPIAPGDSGIIGVVFDSAGKLGPQKPIITVYTNAGKHKLHLDGFVDAERAESDKEEKKPTEKEAPEGADENTPEGGGSPK